MAFEQFEKDMEIIAALDDEPNDVGGLSAAELKAKFDEGGEALKEYINGTLIPALEAITAADVGALPSNGSGVMTGPIKWNGSFGQMSISTDGYNLIISGQNGSPNIVITDDGYIQMTAQVIELDGDMYVHSNVDMDNKEIQNASRVQTDTLSGPSEEDGILVDAPLLMDGNAIKELPDPIDDGDATNKKFVEDYAVAKTSSTNRVYCTDGTGLPVLLQYSKNSAANDSVAVRTSTGQIIVADPVNDQDAVPKKWLGDHYVPKTTDTFKVYGTGASGVPTNYDISQTVSGTTIAQRSPSGNLRTADPLVDTDAANKGWTNAELALKADKAQEAWITPTLINGWTQYDATNSPVGYFMDTLGFVHLRGQLASGVAGTTAFMLPNGYRPSKTTFMVTRANATFAYGSISAGGYIYPSIGAYTTWVALDGISFRAED